MYLSDLSAPFEYLCYGSTVIINVSLVIINVLLVRCGDRL